MTTLTGYYYCPSCSTAFSERDAAVRGEWNPDARRTLYYVHCPACGDSEGLEEAFECEECGDLYQAGLFTDGLCEECELEHGEICRHP